MYNETSYYTEASSCYQPVQNVGTEAWNQFMLNMILQISSPSLRVTHWFLIVYNIKMAVHMYAKYFCLVCKFSIQTMNIKFWNVDFPDRQGEGVFNVVQWHTYHQLQKIWKTNL
jgi:hypothetical protein